ncbi:hypothetical protein L226DRAFT_540630 [Lentinus tigrinus ALCF2SS1-7]|uniref:uncharacterized protein n=1 Tax=Lentinus tigrinus ALCF2SS1-7 TaxID=1328758 RepID=UPI0011660AF7|nr:hypothetical protein L226DRAFT_540630 [Lentinus tigrinus ALCF2SS1-7]
MRALPGLSCPASVLHPGSLKKWSCPMSSCVVVSAYYVLSFAPLELVSVCSPSSASHRHSEPVPRDCGSARIPPENETTADQVTSGHENKNENKKPGEDVDAGPR